MNDRVGPGLLPWPILAAGVIVLLAGCEKAPLAPSTPVSKLVVSPAVDTVSVGGSAQFSAAAYDTAGQRLTGVAVSWSSGDMRIFTVGATGRVQGVGEGTASLYASAGGVRDSARVTVLPGGGWFVQASSTGADLNGVFFLPDGRNGWAVGASGAILHTADAGATWARQVSATSFTLNGVWFTSPAEGWAVGSGGTVLRTTTGGSTWARLRNVGQGDALMDVRFATPDTGWVVGGRGLVLRTFDRGASWQAVRIPTAFALNGVSFAGTRDGWAVGSNGVIAGTHDRGITWFVAPPLTLQPLKAVWRLSEAVAFAAGAQGVTPRTVATPDSTMWELRTAGSSRQLEGLHYPSDLIGYAVGYDAALGGAVLRTDDGGLTWEAQSSRTSFRLNDVYFVDALRGWAVGQGGTIVHTAHGGKP